MSKRYQPDLFGPPLPGLKLGEALITTAEERDLITHIDAVDLAPFRFQMWTGKRLTHSYGWSYDFQNRGFEPTEPIPDWLLPLKERAADFARLDPDALVHAMLIRYDAGAGIGWHRDRPVFDHVIGVSLGAPAVMRFRKREGTAFRRVSAPLAPRSIYLLSGEARHAWEHSITPMAATRWSIAFRSLAGSLM